MNRSRLLLLLFLILVAVAGCDAPSVQALPQEAPTQQTSACGTIQGIPDPDTRLQVIDWSFLCGGQQYLILQRTDQPGVAVLGNTQGDCGQMNVVHLELNSQLWGVLFVKTCGDERTIVFVEVLGKAHEAPQAFTGRGSYSVNFTTMYSHQTFQANLHGETLDTYSIM